MSYGFLVIYEIKPQDPEAFLKYYLGTHLEIVKTWPKIRSIQVERGVEGGPVFIIGRLVFDTLADLKAALASPQREKAGADVANFPPYEGTVKRQIVEIIDVQG